MFEHCRDDEFRTFHDRTQWPPGSALPPFRLRSKWDFESFPPIADAGLSASRPGRHRRPSPEMA
jgi:hypothetical protein